MYASRSYVCMSIKLFAKVPLFSFNIHGLNKDVLIFIYLFIYSKLNFFNQAVALIKVPLTVLF